MNSSMKAVRRRWRSWTLGEGSKAIAVPHGWSLGGEPLARPAPCELGNGSGLCARLAGAGAGSRALFHALGDALQDGGEAEQVVDEIEVPHLLRHRRTAYTPAIALQISRRR